MSKDAKGDLGGQGKRPRRVIGLLLLLIAIALVVAGETVFAPYLRGRAFLIYWAICSLFTLMALLTALVDLVAIRRAAAQAKWHLYQETFGSKKSEPDAKEDSTDS